ncbi:hypothetical protein C7974DRAFT_413739 [Boeremia exigua]|uniref:uncharacterized protein n=1 Tax=Boeremia exigua TaxID=749465 RepID=UPI001E8EE776|nr:uncharacterized protein C7974DRAFT_413739 [Boeremia exigua]KAH6625207.1 hypothetical protein C7974DRAFT_413739 [Boeremia exigua]
MHFSTALLLALTASASAAVLPRSQLGSWEFSLYRSAYASGYQSTIATAVYTSESYPEGLRKECTHILNPFAEPIQTDKCDEGFSYSYDGQTVSLSQVVQKPSANTTVFGNAPLELKVADSVGRSWKGEATVEVSSATA